MGSLPFHWHLVALALVVAIAWLHRVLVHDTHHRRRMGWALVVLLVATMWPLGDLAQSVSLTAATVQRLLIMLVVAPLILLSTTTELLVKLTYPAPVDAIVRRLAHPGMAIILVTVLGTLTLSSPLVDWAATSWGGHVVVLGVVLFVGLLLWVPALAIMPGAKRLSPAARSGYVFGSAIVVTSLSFVWIFAQHSLYPALHGQQAVLHMTPVFDQQLAGFVAKLGAYFPMWAVAYIMLFRADESGVSVDESPLHWADVERQLLRIDRKQARAIRRHRPN